MEIVISFLVAVAAGVTCHLICKWLDSHNKDNEQPSGYSTTEIKREEPSHVLVVHTGVRSLFTWNIIISFLPTGIIAYADCEINMLRLCKSVIFPPFVLKMSQNHIFKASHTSRNGLKSTLSRLHSINTLLSFFKINQGEHSKIPCPVGIISGQGISVYIIGFSLIRIELYYHW